MSVELYLITDADEALEVREVDGPALFRYVYAPATPAREAPRPYLHPVYARSGEILTNFRPNDHPWHHGLSLTINQVDGWNFWGGPTYRAGEGYRWQENHGVQRHLEWVGLAPRRLEQSVAWETGKGERLLNERRVLTVEDVTDHAWALGWQSVLRNVTARELVLSNYHSGQGLKGSHYTGLQFRGRRELLDDHGDAEVGIWADGEVSGEAAVHGLSSAWMEWRGQMDTTLRRVKVRFENGGEPVHWFVRRNNPLAALAFQFDRDRGLAPGGELRLHHRLVFTDLP
ncbi:PmoA family protein [Opitutus sp. ER46]|uniref:DUF6807 domain-containing protein n=1 Tax=Opitutus sp. ER46 TaxID=2161864 RepID=UPI000D31B007|nr:PmoA family protein [Opitutus sp. ER46]PTX94475.1 hypothetical protein DB354_12075 [Opitutus sp. ER46]